DGTEAKQTGFVDGVLGRQALFALGFERKIDHHDGVLFHDADQQNNSYQRNNRQVRPEHKQRQQRADTGGGKSGKDRDWVDIALIQHSQYDVDGDHGGKDEQGFGFERGLKRLGSTSERAVYIRRHRDIILRSFNRSDGVAQRAARSQRKGQGDGRKLALVVDRERTERGAQMSKCRDRHRGAAIRADVDQLQRLRILLKLGQHFHDD